jgi:hypothetical protein
MNIKQFLGIRPEITKYTIHSDKIPKSFDGFCIAHISDTHSRPAKGLFELIKEQNPDIICISGDMFHDDDSDACNFWSLFSDLLSLAPVYLVSGNHDVWHTNYVSFFKRITDLGGILMDSKMRIIERNGEKISLFGVGDPFSKVPKLIEESLNSSFLSLPQFDGYKILLFHRANLFDKIKDLGFDLILSGHMHGGQIRVPFIGGTLAPTSSILSERMIFPRYTGGKYEHENSCMIVNRGASNTLSVPRFANPPEVGIITLFSKK